MPSDHYTRRVCAILLADVSGFSALMGADEEGTAHAIDRLRPLILHVVTERQGHAEAVAGDAFFATFDSVVAAVDAALEIQRQLARQEFAGRALQLRIGVHVGDVLFHDDTAVGDAINIAARLQSLARPGTVCVSEGVYRQVHTKFDETFTDLGSKRLKNISDPMHLYLIEPTTEAGRTRRSHSLFRTLLVGGCVAVATGLAASLVYWPGLRGSTPAPTGDRRSPSAASTDTRQLTIGVMRFRSIGEDPVHAWMPDALRDGLNADLSRLQNVKIYSKEFIDFLTTRRNLTEVEAATELGVAKMLSGSVMITDGQVRVETHVVDVTTGVLESSHTVEGTDAALIDLQRDVLYGVLAGLGVRMTAEDRAQLAGRDTNAEALRLLLEAEQGAEPAPSSKPTSRLLSQGTTSIASRMRRVTPGLVATALAAAADASDGEILAFVERYRAATESRDLDALAALYTEFTNEQRVAHERYFVNTRELHVSIDKVDVAVIGQEAVVSFTRTDDFTDAGTGRTIHLSVRLTKILARDDGGWKIAKDE